MNGNNKKIRCVFKYSCKKRGANANEIFEVYEDDALSVRVELQLFTAFWK